jgi:hypothetical protein
MIDTEPTILHDWSALSWRRDVELTEPATIYRHMNRIRMREGRFVFATGGDTRVLKRLTPTERRELHAALAATFSARYGTGKRSLTNSLGRIGDTARLTAAAMRELMHRLRS